MKLENRSYPWPFLSGIIMLILTVGFLVTCLVLNHHMGGDDVQGSIKKMEETIIICDVLAALFGGLTIWVIVPTEHCRVWNFIASFILGVGGTFFVYARFLIVTQVNMSYMKLVASHSIILGFVTLMMTGFVMAPW